LVALNAEHLLRSMFNHRVIPAAGEPPRNGLPPVPLRPANDLTSDADERIWAAWHGENRATLHRNWRIWWEANRDSVKIE
jgi:hypothetical protein